MKIIITEEQKQILKLIVEMDNIKPSKSAVKNICDSEKFCNAQGEITFGQLRALVESTTRKRLFQHVGEGGFKATIRLIPWFIPQLIIAGVIGSADPLSKIFFISDGLMTMMDNKYKVKFARYIANLASEKPDDEVVPEYFVENELRKWVNDKFLLDPPLPPKI
jgi:hypothetical protein